MREVDHLAPPGLHNLPQRHHCCCPAGERSYVVARVGLGALGWSGGIPGQVHHSAEGLRDRVVTRATQVVLLTVLPVRTYPHDHEAGIDGERQLVGDTVAFERAGRRRFHPHVRNLPQGHQQLDSARLLEVESHRQLILCDFGLVASMGAGPAC